MKYKTQITEMVNDLERKIKDLKLADEICKARFERGIDKVPCDIYLMLSKMKDVGRFWDDESIFYLMMREEI